MTARAPFNFMPALLTGGALLLAVIAWCGWSLFVVTPADRDAYEKLVLEANPINSAVQVSPYKAQQQRKAVQKDIFFGKGTERLQLRLVSQEALLVVDHGPDGTELIEKMQDVACWMQEELFYLLPDGREALRQSDGRLLVRDGNPDDPANWTELFSSNAKPMQILRFFEAQEATYYYKTERVEADQVKIFRYLLPGHALNFQLRDQKPLMEGNAKKVEFSLAGEDVDFKAYQLKASFKGLRGT